MNLKGLAISAGLGAMVGAVAVLMMPQNNPARKLAEKAADMAEIVACQLTDKMTQMSEM